MMVHIGMPCQFLSISLLVLSWWSLAPTIHLASFSWITVTAIIEYILTIFDQNSRIRIRFWQWTCHWQTLQICSNLKTWIHWLQGKKITTTFEWVYIMIACISAWNWKTLAKNCKMQVGTIPHWWTLPKKFWKKHSRKLFLLISWMNLL